MQTRFMMVNQHICDDMAGAMEMSETLFAPALAEMEADGVIHDWGFLTHAWGDEWNFNWYMVTDDHASFLEAWADMFERVSARDADWFARFDPMCQEHKDNLYSLHDMDAME